MAINQDLPGHVLALRDSKSQSAVFPGGVWIVIVGAIGLLILCITQHLASQTVLVVVGALAVVPAWKLWLLARRDPAWLAFCLMAAQVFDGLFFLNDQIRPIISYGLTLIFCLPAIPALWLAWKERNSGFRLYLLFSIWCLITVWYSLAPEFSIARLGRNLLMFGAIALCSTAVRKADDIKRLIRALMLAAAGATMITAAALLLPHDIAWSSGDRDIAATVQGAGAVPPEPTDNVQRFSGLYDNPNEVGAVAMLTVGLILTYFGFANTRERIILCAIASMAVVLTIMADSRSDIAGFGIGIALYLCWKYRMKGILAIAVLAVAAVLGIKLAGSSATSYIWRGDVWTLTGRTDVWQFALGQIAARPFTGYGWATGGAIFNSKYFPLWWDLWAQGAHTSIHNGYLSHMVEVGIPATILWLFIILRPWVSLFRETEDRWCLKRAFFLLVIPMLIINCDESVVTDCAGAGFLFMMLWAAAERYRLMMIRDRLLLRRQTIERLPAAVAALRS